MHRWLPSLQLWLVLTALVVMERFIALGHSRNICRYLNLHGLFTMMPHVWTLLSWLPLHLQFTPTRPMSHLLRSRYQLQMLPRLPSAVLRLPLPLTPTLSHHCVVPHTSRVMSPILHTLLPHHDVDRHPTQPPVVLAHPLDNVTREHVRLVENMVIQPTDVICSPWPCSFSGTLGIGPMQNL